MILTPRPLEEQDLEATVLRVFLKVIDLVGGPKALPRGGASPGQEAS